MVQVTVPPSAKSSSPLRKQYCHRNQWQQRHFGYFLHQKLRNGSMAFLLFVGGCFVWFLRNGYDVKTVGDVVVRNKKAVGSIKVSSSSSSSASGTTAATSSAYSVHHDTIDGIDVIWSQPSTDHQQPQLAGILFVAHGCSHSNTDWFIKAKDENEFYCEDCIGLPEERAIVQIAMNNFGFAVVALSSRDRRSKCWSVAADADRVGRVLRWFVASDPNRRKNAPIYAFGVSSGGRFVSLVGQDLLQRHRIKLSGFISQISASSPNSDDEDDNNGLSCQVYITMNMDEWTSIAATNIVSGCNSDNREGRGLEPCKHISLLPLPIHSTYFSDRIPEIPQDESAEMVRIFKRHGIINETTNMLIDDPRTDWSWKKALLLSSSEATAWGDGSSSSTVAAVLKFRERGDDLIPDESPISEVMNVAWGYHELTRDGVQEALEFCVDQQHRIRRGEGSNRK